MLELEYMTEHGDFGTSPMGDILELNRQLMKAQEANTSVTDIALQTQLGALQPQSLDDMLFSLTYNQSHFVLWNDIPKAGARSTLEEYNVRDGYGTEGGFTTQMETPEEADFSAKRGFTFMKFIRHLWKISDVGTMVQTVPSAEIEQKQAAVMRTLRTATFGLYTGNSSLIPESIDGFYKVITDTASSGHIIDARGGSVTQLHFDQITEAIFSNFGIVDGISAYYSPGAATAINQILRTGNVTAPQVFIPVGPDGKIDPGYSTGSITTQFGRIRPRTDIFLANMFESKAPPVVYNDSHVLVEGSTSRRAPVTPVTINATVNAPPVVGSKWASTGVRPAGSVYRYRVTAVNRFGESVGSAVVTPGGAVAANGSVTVTITPNPASADAATGFHVYSEQVTGSGVYRWCGSVAANGLTPVAFEDLNEHIPGTAVIFVLDLTSNGPYTAFRLKQLAPLYSQEMARIGMYRWGVTNLYITPQYIGPRRFGMIKNVGISSETVSPLLQV